MCGVILDPPILTGHLFFFVLRAAKGAEQELAQHLLLCCSFYGKMGRTFKGRFDSCNNNVTLGNAVTKVVWASY